MSEENEFEQALGKPPEQPSYVLRLFITGANPRSARAIQNIRAICDERLPGQVELEVIDLYQHPELAGAENVVVAPTLVKLLPPPVRHLIGDLSNLARVLAGLDLVPRVAAKEPAHGA
jgi:circadian clock protein KaiB